MNKEKRIDFKKLELAMVRYVKGIVHTMMNEGVKDPSFDEMIGYFKETPEFAARMVKSEIVYKKDSEELTTKEETVREIRKNLKDCCRDVLYFRQNHEFPSYSILERIIADSTWMNNITSSQMFTTVQVMVEQEAMGFISEM